MILVLDCHACFDYCKMRWRLVDVHQAHFDDQQDSWKPSTGFVVVKTCITISNMYSTGFLAVQTGLLNLYRPSTGIAVVKRGITILCRLSTTLLVVKRSKWQSPSTAAMLELLLGILLASTWLKVFYFQRELLINHAGTQWALPRTWSKLHTTQQLNISLP